MQYQIRDIRLNGERKDFCGLISTDCLIFDSICRGRTLRIETIGGVLRTSPIKSVKKIQNQRAKILRLETENGYMFYLEKEAIADVS